MHSKFRNGDLKTNLHWSNKGIHYQPDSALPPNCTFYSFFFGHLTNDMSLMTMTCDMWNLTSQHFSFLALTVYDVQICTEFWIYFHKPWLNESISDRGVCRTAAAPLDVLIITNTAQFRTVILPWSDLVTCSNLFNLVAGYVLISCINILKVSAFFHVLGQHFSISFRYN